mmetsp:Transcript_36938/g.92754  ORF Transcript_36938/g.92754 Transcript_36938/m.92754 type:complete len:222 (+) Transcript_36938:929-1594(+)
MHKPWSARPLPQEHKRNCNKTSPPPWSELEHDNLDLEEDCFAERDAVAASDADPGVLTNDAADLPPPGATVALLPLALLRYVPAVAASLEELDVSSGLSFCKPPHPPQQQPPLPSEISRLKLVSQSKVCPGEAATVAAKLEAVATAPKRGLGPEVDTKGADEAGTDAERTAVGEAVEAEITCWDTESWALVAPVPKQLMTPSLPRGGSRPPKLKARTTPVG